MTKALKRRPVRKVSFNTVTIERQVEDFFADIEMEDVSSLSSSSAAAAAESAQEGQINYDADIDDSDEDQDLDHEDGDGEEMKMEWQQDKKLENYMGEDDVSWSMARSLSPSRQQRSRSPSSPGSSPFPQTMQKKGRSKNILASKTSNLTINTDLNEDISSQLPHNNSIALKVRNFLEDSEIKDRSFVNLLSPNPMEKTTRQLEIVFDPVQPSIPQPDLPSLSRSPVPRTRRRRIDSMASDASDDTVIESVLIPSPIFSKSDSVKLNDPIYLAALKARRQRLQMLMLGIGDESTDLFDATLVISETPLPGENENKENGF